MKHKCEKMDDRFGNRFEIFNFKGVWFMVDYKYGIKYIEIEYCPFCGIKLSDLE